MESPLDQHPLGRLPREDLDLIVRFVLASGSLKALAEEFGVSYPTIRARLDRLIERMRATLSDRAPDPVIEELAEMVEAGAVTPASARRLRDVYRTEASCLGRRMSHV